MGLYHAHQGSQIVIADLYSEWARKSPTSIMEDILTIILAVAAAVIVVLLTTLVIVCYKWFGQYESPKPKSRRSLYVKQSGEPQSVPGKKYFPAEFHTFMQGVIKTFQSQRKEADYEFAVLFLSEHRKLQDISTNVKFPTEATDSESRTFPPDADLVNYVTAGPREHEHAETILLGKLDKLMAKFGEEKCKTIVLYTWLLPCDSRPNRKDCKATIIEKLGPWAKSKAVILVYTSKMSGDESGENPGVSDKKETEIVRDIEANNIRVLKEIYYTTLQPLSESQGGDTQEGQ